MLGALVRTAEACRDVAVAYGTPFISGKDSLNNEYRSPTQRIAIPHTLLVSALGRVPDVRKCVTMDLKEPGNDLYLVGRTKDELGGSHLHLVTGRTGGTPPRARPRGRAPKVFAAVHRAISDGLVRSCHDLSEGGLAVAVAEMAFAGGVGADVTELPGGRGAVGRGEAVQRIDHPVPDRGEAGTRGPAPAPASPGCRSPRIGTTVADPRLRIAGSNGEWLVWAKLADLKEAWQKPLRW